LSNLNAFNGPTLTFGRQYNISDISEIEDLHDLHEQFSDPEMDDDNAYLHFNPGVDDQQHLGAPSEKFVPPEAMSPPHSVGNIITVHSPGPKSKTSFQPQTTYIADIFKDIPRTKGTGAKRKGKGLAEPEEYPGELWEAHLKERIVRDVNLHLRILRYEVSEYSMCLTALLTRNVNVAKPIHFEVFVKLAMDESSCPSSGKLRAHLRKYLDKEVYISCMMLISLMTVQGHQLLWSRAEKPKALIWRGKSLTLVSSFSSTKVIQAMNLQRNS